MTAKEPRLWAIAGVGSEDRTIAMDQFERITKAQWCELFYHLYYHSNGQPAAPFIVEDIRERLEIIESYCKAMGLLGRR